MRTNQSAISSDQISSIYDEKGHGLLTCLVLKGIKNENEMRREGSINIRRYIRLRQTSDRIDCRKAIQQRTTTAVDCAQK